MRKSFLVQNIGSSQVNHNIIEFLNRYTQDGEHALLFFEHVHRHPQRLLFASMNMLSAINYGGMYITADALTLEYALKFPCKKKILFYIWDFEWMQSVQPYRDWKDVYCHPDVVRIARTEHYKDVIEGCFNTTVKYVCEDFDYEQMKNIIKQEDE